MKSTLLKISYICISVVALFFLIFYSYFRKLFVFKRNKKIIFGAAPILNNKYWSKALQEHGYDTMTLMKRYYKTINQKEDYDLYFDDLIPKFLRFRYVNEIAYLFFVWIFIIHNAKYFVMPFRGVVFYNYLWRMEYLLFRINRIKTIVLPYGSDAYMYSRIKDSALQNALLINYPDAAKCEKAIEKKVFFWSKYADFTMAGFMGLDGMPRWDIPIHQFVHIDTKQWLQKKHYSLNDGKNGNVKVLHSPNHRGFKGTEYLVKAIEALQQEGLLVELVLLEKVPNKYVKELMHDVDILAEQFIFTGYALSGIEGMASGLPVLANLENDRYTKVFRRYSFLDECPILSTAPETLKEHLRLLITSPHLRKELGELGRKYVQKYHSYQTTQYLFGKIFKKLDGEDIDLMNLFHPLMSEYVKNDYIYTPLKCNRYDEKENH